MPVFSDYRPEPHFAALGDDFSDVVAPADFPQTLLRFRNDRAAKTVGLQSLDQPEWLAAFGRLSGLPGQAPPRAMRYHGHQFRSYNPNIGDGRGFLYAQMRGQDGRLLDLGTKGSGQTPYSRSGDGRLTLKGGVREVLATAMLEANGVNTSKSLSLIETGEKLHRNDEPSPTRSAILVRLCHSHIRFGTFQRHAYFGATDNIRQLIAHIGALYYPEIVTAPEEEQPVALLRATIAANSRLTGQWMAAGFVHGVLNTDNINITGESFDYGPYRFLPHSDPLFTAAYFDQTGLYAFGRQPQAMGWNFAALAVALEPVATRAMLAPALEAFPQLYQQGLRDAVFDRLGLVANELEVDAAFLGDLFAWMTAHPIKWEQFFFDWRGGEASAARALAGPAADLYRLADFLPIRAEIERRSPPISANIAQSYFQQARPETLLIDEIEAIWSAIAERDDWSLFEAKLDAIEMKRRAYFPDQV